MSWKRSLLPGSMAILTLHSKTAVGMILEFMLRIKPKQQRGSSNFGSDNEFPGIRIYWNHFNHHLLLV